MSKSIACRAKTFCLLLALTLPFLGCENKVNPGIEDTQSSNWRDLNKNGELDIYEDVSKPIHERVDNLLSLMTLEEKVGTLLHGTLPAVDSPIGISEIGYDFEWAEKKIQNLKITSFVTGLNVPPTEMAEMNNRIQEMAETSRLGIPVTISSDPRHHLKALVGASNRANGFSTWPETLGMTAIGDADLAFELGSIVRRDYRAVGIHMALSPQADLASEPRWPRLFGTYGSDPEEVSRLTGAYIQGVQGSPDGVATDGVASVVKHWVGYSAAVDGYDAHNYYGRKSDLNPETFELHAKAFKGAFDANVAGVMPSYSVLENLTVDGKKIEEIGGGFSKVLLTDLLKEREGFDGFVLTDWLTLGDCPENCSDPTQDKPQTPMDIGMPWGLIDKSVGERVATALDAGVDQFGGFESPQLVLEMIEAGAISEDRIDVSARKILTLKYQLGLFENPYVDAEKAVSIVGDEISHQNGFEAQKKAQVLLKNEDQILPLQTTNQKLWLIGVDKEIAVRKGLQLTDNMEDADTIVVRLQTPAERLHPYHFFAQFQKEGRMDYTVGNPDYDFISSIPPSQKVVVAVDMDRAAVLTNLMDRSDAVISLFGATDSALLDVIIGRTEPQGRLPFNLPSSWEAVQAQNPGRPDDDIDPLFVKGFGLRYD